MQIWTLLPGDLLRIKKYGMTDLHPAKLTKYYISFLNESYSTVTYILVMCEGPVMGYSSLGRILTNTFHTPEDCFGALSGDKADGG